MTHYPSDGLDIRIRGGFWGGQNPSGVEDIERLVLHGANIEVVHCYNVEQVNVVLPTKSLFVPPIIFKIFE